MSPLCTGRVPFIGQTWERDRVCVEMENSRSNWLNGKDDKVMKLAFKRSKG